MKTRSTVWIHYDLMRKGKGESEWQFHSEYQSKYAALARWEELCESEPDTSWQVIVWQKSRRVIESNIADGDNVIALT